MRRQSTIRVGRPSIFRLRATRRLVLSWTHWRQKRTTRRQKREQERLRLMLLQLDRQHLLIKELEQTQAMLAHRLEELNQSEAYRTQNLLPAPPANPELEMQQRLDELLGLGR